MEKAKLPCQMKKMLYTIVATYVLTACSGQEKRVVTYPKEKIMNTDKFDIIGFRNWQQEKEMKGDLSECEDTLSDNTVITYYSTMESPDEISYTKVITPPPPALFYSTKIFYPTGVIKEELEQIFIGLLKAPPLIVKEYDEQGYLLQTTDNSGFDKDVKLRFDALLQLLIQEPILTSVAQNEREDYSFYLFHHEVAPQDVTVAKILEYLTSSEDCNGKILNPYSDFDRRNLIIWLEGNVWNIKKDMYPRGIFHYTFDANTGKRLSTKYAEEYRP